MTAELGLALPRCAAASGLPLFNFRGFGAYPRSGFMGGGATGAAGVEVAQEGPAETQEAILPLGPYLATLRWVVIARALTGISVAIDARREDWKRGRR